MRAPRSKLPAHYINPARNTRSATAPLAPIALLTRYTVSGIVAPITKILATIEPRIHDQPSLGDAPRCADSRARYNSHSTVR